MDAPAALHPTDETLLAYGLGRLDDASAESVHGHLGSCPGCRERVAELSGDSFVDRLRDAQGQPARRIDGQTSSVVPGGSRGQKTTGEDATPPELAELTQYEVIRQIGFGGMGVVYLARNTMLDRLEVLKVLNRDMLERRGVADRFLREMRSAAKLSHPNVVGAFAAHQLGHLLVFAMEYVEGDDLSKLVKTRGPLPVDQACFFIYQAALGLQHAHEKGMVHRDIKPGNLILSRQGKRAVVKVLDFGLAKATREEPVDGGLTQEGQMLGTPDYIAPEQTIDAQKSDIRADIYSLGCTFYYLLTGGPPFKGTSLYDILQAHHSMDARPLNLARPEVPFELAAVVAKMMAKDPAGRFQTPAGVAEALKPFFRKASARPNAEMSEATPIAGPKPAGAGSPPPQPATDAGAATVRTKKAAEPAVPEVRWETLLDFKETERSTAAVKPKPEVAPTSAPVRRVPWAWASIAIGVLLFGLVAASVVVLRTKNGTIVLENLPEQSVVTADGDTVTVEWPDGKGEGHAQITISPGKHSLGVEANGVQMRGEEVIVESGGVTRFVVRIDPLPDPTDASAQPTDGISRRPFDPKQFTNDGGRWIVQGNELMQTEGRVHWPCLMFGDEQWTDYDFTVDLMRLHGLEAAYLVVRGEDKDNQVVFTNSGWSGTRSIIEVVEKGKMLAQRHVDRRFENLKWYTARVQVRGSKVVGTLLDGATEVARVEAVVNGLRPQGRVGLRTWWSAYRFKNIRVTAPEGQTLWEGPPAIESPRPFGPAAPENPYRAGWVSLFNGKDLSGWTAFRGNDETAPEAIFFVDRNELACFPGNWGRLATQAAYSNFVLSLDYFIGGGDDAGLSFLTVPAQGVESMSFECQIRGEQPNDEYGCGDIYSVKPLLTRPQAPSKDGGFFGRMRRADLTEGGWNTYEICNEGKKFTVRLNGVIVNEVSSTSEGPWRVSPQAEGRGSARFRNIAIKGLDGKPPTIASRAPAPVVDQGRPVPPAMDRAVKKKYCDLIDFNSEYKYQLASLRKGSLQYAEYNWRVYESKSRFFAKDAFGRDDVLLTHGFGGERPAKIDFSRITKDRTGELVLIVHSFPDAANDGSRIVVKVNNKEFHRSRVRFAEGWKAITVPFNNSSVVVEHFPVGWSWEYAFIDFVIKEQSGPQAGDNPDRDGLNPVIGSGQGLRRAAPGETVFQERQSDRDFARRQ